MPTIEFRRRHPKRSPSPPARDAATIPIPPRNNRETVPIVQRAADGGPIPGESVECVTTEGDGNLLDICDKVRAPISFSCRGATCGTCLVRVISGAESLRPPANAELALLRGLGLVGSHRLACQARILAGNGRLVLSCEGPDERQAT